MRLTRRERLGRWWATARSTVIVNTWESRFWIVVGIVGGFTPASKSIQALWFISCYANSKAGRAEAQGAKIEMREEEAEDA